MGVGEDTAGRGQSSVVMTARRVGCLINTRVFVGVSPLRPAGGAGGGGDHQGVQRSEGDTLPGTRDRRIKTVQETLIVDRRTRGPSGGRQPAGTRRQQTERRRGGRSVERRRPATTLRNRGQIKLKLLQGRGRERKRGRRRRGRGRGGEDMDKKEQDDGDEVGGRHIERGAAQDGERKHDESSVILDWAVGERGRPTD